mgnify:FL=1|tara:strand:+ start:49 stop:471 length:423 start_codon:yes stop_codon:yes gene_type:complete
MSLNEATPAQWDALRKKHPAIVEAYEHYFDKGIEEEMPEYDQLERELELEIHNDEWVEEDYLEYPSVDEEDMINNPNHYNNGAIECIDAIEQSMTLEGFRGYLKGNVQKYVWRYESKGGLQDLMKAHWYLNKLISVTEED